MCSFYIYLPFEGWLKLGTFRGKALSNLISRTAFSGMALKPALLLQLWWQKSLRDPCRERNGGWSNWKRICLCFCCFAVFEEKQFHVECWWRWTENEDLCKLLMLAAMEREILRSQPFCQHGEHREAVLIPQISSCWRGLRGDSSCGWVALLNLIRRGKKNLLVGINMGRERMNCSSLRILAGLAYSIESTQLMSLPEGDIAPHVEAGVQCSKY